ncbi:hypothetical protein AAT19DRAFT_11325 [Rhodotorula toruloides]|uniref:Uncharacterized protein n=1 Tax=Rhodotorula toruloides TaxID=5286 RepID=A0A2S9ZXT9_RHOTO|nr:hypothetical protein AAT19DRAFT_11325 [Rhodotorula toruloides]
MRRQQERDEEILELKDWIILERSLRAPIRIEWASEQVQEETKQKLPGLTSLFQTQPKPATQQYSAMTTELLENVKESLEKLEGLVKPDDKQLRTLAIQAIEHCQIDKPARKTRSSSDPEAEDGTSEDDLSKAGPRGRICQTKNFNIFATSPSFARDRSQQNSEVSLPSRRRPTPRNRQTRTARKRRTPRRSPSSLLVCDGRPDEDQYQCWTGHLEPHLGRDQRGARRVDCDGCPAIAHPPSRLWFLHGLRRDRPLDTGPRSYRSSSPDARRRTRFSPQPPRTRPDRPLDPLARRWHRRHRPRRGPHASQRHRRGRQGPPPDQDGSCRSAALV